MELLGSDTTLELTLNSLAANWHLMTTGDAAGAKSLLAAAPPGSASLAPTWAQEQALAYSKLQYQAAERAAAGWGEANPKEGLTADGSTTLRKRGAWIAKAKPEPKPKAAGGCRRERGTAGGGCRGGSGCISSQWSCLPDMCRGD